MPSALAHDLLAREDGLGLVVVVESVDEEVGGPAQAATVLQQSTANRLEYASSHPLKAKIVTYEGEGCRFVLLYQVNIRRFDCFDSGFCSRGYCHGNLL